MVDDVKNGKDVYIKFGPQHYDRAGSIAKIKKVTGRPANPKGKYYEQSSSYEFHLKWDKRTNTCKIQPDDYEIIYLEGYIGPTVWEKIDLKALAKEGVKPIYDRLGTEITVGNTVTFINARYGSGANIDFGVVEKIEFKAGNSCDGVSVNAVVHIKTIPLSDTEKSVNCKIKQHERSVMVMTESFMDEAMIAKLTYS